MPRSVRRVEAAPLTGALLAGILSLDLQSARCNSMAPVRIKEGILTILRIRQPNGGKIAKCHNCRRVLGHSGCSVVRSAALLIVALVLGPCLASVSVAETFVVPDDYPTISAAYAASGPWGGDTILLRSGTYEGGLNITKPVCIEGAAEASAVRLIGGTFIVHVDSSRPTADVFAVFHDVSFVGSQVVFTYDGGGTLAGGSISNCVFEDATVEMIYNCRASIVGNLFLGGGSKTAIAIDFFMGTWGTPGAYIRGNTVVGYDKFIDAVFRGFYIFSVESNIIADCNVGIECYDPPGTTWSLRCNDIIDCDVGYAGFGDLTGVDGNFSRDPEFCDQGADDFSLQASSPCLPGNHPDAYECGLVGLLPFGCEAPVATDSEGWGSLKCRFR